MAAINRNSRALDVALLICRIALGVIFIAHGGQKLFGLWGGEGLNALVNGGAHPGMGPLGYFVAIGEFFGGVGVLVGLLSRFSAFWLIVIMLGAIVQVHGKNGLLMQFGGYEYNLALIGLSAVTLLAGPGAYAVANLIPRRPVWLE